ncbi:serine O-acetyltransferase [Zunongwangia endophytica]|uniref:Serine O-acetyltransferase n=1 Tax=Zunongwangia endophytica TaxID=1808945 RepID=A0ABV8HDZ1_9FLAO|nr:serine acetyltransferase [Zunongwangia endophytica]MDN3596245.1 serine acetyltransferase [Zunongwangia endophytica]
MSIVASILTKLSHIVFSCSVPYQAEIGKNFKLGHGGLGVVINKKTKIGYSCTISTCVTIGGTNKIDIVPKLGNNIYVGSGARILGPVIIGDNVVIGANSVVVKDIPSNCVVAGVPAKVIKENIKIEDYI